MDLTAILYTKKMFLSMYYFGEYIQTLSCTNKNQSITTLKTQFDFLFVSLFLTHTCLTTFSSTKATLRSFTLTLAGFQGSN